MKLTKGGLYQVIVFMKLTRQFKYPEDIDVAEAVAKKLRFKSSDSLKLIVKSEMKSLKRKNSSKQNFLSSKYTDIKDDQNENILYTDDLEQDDDNSTDLNGPEVCREEFRELGNKMQRARTDNLLKILYNLKREIHSPLQKSLNICYIE